jgi:acyl carrier protein
MDAAMTMTQDEVLDQVAQMVREVIGEEWALDVPITMETSFSRDLELESIEFVALAESISRGGCRGWSSRKSSSCRWASS